MSENLSQEYDLFISYRSESSGRHAAALRDALYAFDKRRFIHGHPQVWSD